MKKIAVFVGSLREKSLNKSLATALEAMTPADVEFVYVDSIMPLYNQDEEADFPPKAQAAKDIVEAADGVLFVTPEYNRSVPGVLKNAIDWTSRPWGHNSFAGKPAGILGASMAPTGTAIAQSDLRHILGFLDVKLMGQPEVYMGNAANLFDDEGNLTDKHWQANLKKYIDSFIARIEANN